MSTYDGYDVQQMLNGRLPCSALECELVQFAEQQAAEIERLRGALRQAESSYSETLLQLGSVSKERDHLKAILQDVNTTDYRFSVDQLAAHDAEVIERFISERLDEWPASLANQLSFEAHEYANQLRAKAKGVES